MNPQEEDFFESLALIARLVQEGKAKLVSAKSENGKTELNFELTENPEPVKGGYNLHFKGVKK